MTTQAELDAKAERGECLNCGGIRWDRYRHINGTQSDTQLSVDIRPGEYVDVMDYYGEENVEVDDSWDEDFTCHGCGLTLDVEDYLTNEETPAVTIHVTARTHATR